MPRVLTPLGTAAVLRALSSADLDMSVPSMALPRVRTVSSGGHLSKKRGRTPISSAQGAAVLGAFQLEPVAGLFDAAQPARCAGRAIAEPRSPGPKRIQDHGVG